MIFKTFSSLETKKLGVNVARKIIQTPLSGRARVLALVGNLGAGKTTFVQGFYKGLGLRRSPVSPTFILMRRAKLARGPFRNVFHLDAYRLASSRELGALNFKTLLADPQNLILIEWADKVKDALPRGTSKINFAHGARADERRISLPAELS